MFGRKKAINGDDLDDDALIEPELDLVDTDAMDDAAGDDGPRSDEVNALTDGEIAARAAAAELRAHASARAARWGCDKASIESAYGMTDHRVIDTVTPAPRVVEVPWWTAVPVVVSLLVTTLRASGEVEQFGSFDRVCFVGAMLGLALFAARLEDKVFALVRQHHVVQRFVVAAVVVLVGLVGSVVVLAPSREMPYVGNRLAAMLLLFGFWVSSAAVGSMVMLLIDVVLRALVSDFRRRIVSAVLSLLALIFALCGYIAFHALEWVAMLQTDTAGGVNVLHHFGFTLDNVPSVDSLAKSPERFVLGAFLGGAVATLPAIVSVCSKLAETVMERISPIMLAVDRVAEGDRAVHLEEAGSPEFLSLALCFNEMVDKLYLGERIERAFGQYVSREVLDRIRIQAGSVTLPPQVKNASVFFADIRGFTALSEKLAPENVVNILNRYLEEVVPVVEQYNGFLNKFVGDAVVVVFNGPIQQPDHAERATRCAIAVQQRVAELNAQGAFVEIGMLGIGIGIASGPMLCGNVGTNSRMEYTVIGDTVNLSSRMTGHARAGEVWVSAGTAQGLPATIVAVPHPPLKFKGKENAVVPYWVWPPASAADGAPGRS